MTSLSSTQRKYLRGLAHDKHPLVLIGKKGISADLVAEVSEALDAHELVKIKFNDHKENRRELAKLLEEQTASILVGEVGNTVILYKQHPQTEKRQIKL